MKSDTVTFRFEDEDAEVLVNGASCVTANHDVHGWAGIDLMRDTAKGIAALLGAEFEEI